MTIRPTDPDEPVAINGVQVTGRQLAQARQELSHRGVHNPRWAELSPHDQDMAALSAANWLRSLADLAPGRIPGQPDPTDELGPSPAQMGETTTLPAGEWYPLDDHGTEIYVYGGKPVDIAFQTIDMNDKLRELQDLRRLFALQQTRMDAATARWRAEDPEARALILPDLGDLLQWLIEESDKARSDI